MGSDGSERAAGDPSDSDTQWTVAIDGGFGRGNRKSECSSFEVLTGRLATEGRTPHVFAFSRSLETNYRTPRKDSRPSFAPSPTEHIQNSPLLPMAQTTYKPLPPAFPFLLTHFPT